MKQFLLGRKQSLLSQIVKWKCIVTSSIRNSSSSFRLFPLPFFFNLFSFLFFPFAFTKKTLSKFYTPHSSFYTRTSFFSILLLLILTSCQPEQRYNGKSIFRYNVSDGITSLDPAFSRSIDNVSAVNQLFNGLVEIDKNLKLRPSLAESWEVLDSGKIYRFKLRKGVYFHKSEVFGDDSTREVIASDFVYSFNRLIDPEVISPGKWLLNEVQRNYEGALDVHAIDKYTLEINLKRSFPPFLGILSMQYFSAVPKEAVEYYGSKFRANPIGTGPFKFQFWKENTKLVFLRNENYFEKDEEGQQLPYLDAVSISFIKDLEVTFLKFLKLEIDYLTGLKGSYKDELLTSDGKLRQKYTEQVIFTTSPYLNTEYLGFLVDETKEPLSKDIRRAINYGFERDKMLKYLRSGIGIPANQGFIPKGLPAFSEATIGYSYQPDSVYALLERAGFSNGKGLPEVSLSTTAQYLDICEYLQSQLATFGIKIKVEVNQAATNNELIANSKAQFFRKSWVADYPDAENYLSLFKSENFSPNGPNFTHFKSQRFDVWYDKALSEVNDSLRISLYRRMDSLVIAEAPVVPLFYDQVVRFTQPTISGLGVNPMNLLVLKYAKKPTEK
ncbi:MAG: ABC-type transport system substrate-binding protein [Vicingaceae bacterium]|jgi:ABC-type transport system substrate-binding protein